MWSFLLLVVSSSNSRRSCDIVEIMVTGLQFIIVLLGFFF